MLHAVTGCDERYLGEWLSAQAASDYAKYDPATRRLHLAAEQAVCLADPDHPAFVAGGMTVAAFVHKD